MKDGEVAVSSEHDGARWIEAGVMRANMTDEQLDGIAEKDERIAEGLRVIRDDLDRSVVRRG